MSEFTPGIQKVLDHVAATKGWRLRQPNTVSYDGHRDGGWISRLNPQTHEFMCPVSSMSGLDCCLYDQAAEDHGIPEDDYLALVFAADARESYDHELRAALLKAARLA